MVKAYMTSQCGKYTIWTNPADIDYLKNHETGEITQSKICAEWTLSNAYTQTMPGKEGLLIGKKGMHLKNLQERMNSVNGEGSVHAIWATKNSENRTVFSVLGNNLDAVVCALMSIKLQSELIVSNHGWVAVWEPMTLLIHQSQYEPSLITVWKEASSPEDEINWQASGFGWTEIAHAKIQ